MKNIMVVCRVIIVVVGCLFSVSILYAQTLTIKTTLGGLLLDAKMKSAPFPHAARNQGYTYKEKLYSASEHYSDSSVRIFLPTGVFPSATRQGLSLVIYLHGWYNSIDSACRQFRILEQFAAANKQAVLIFPEGPKFAPDSFGGKLEDTLGLQCLVQESLMLIKRSRNLDTLHKLPINSVILCGHSGAYRAIAKMLRSGGMNAKISEVWLFDALYGERDSYLSWITHKVALLKKRMIVVYTNDGGTTTQTAQFSDMLKKQKIPFKTLEETKDFPKKIGSSGVYFIHSDLTHNDVIAKRDQLLYYLKTSVIKPKQQPHGTKR